MAAQKIALTALIESSGVQRYVLIPEPIAAQLGKDEFIPVTVTIGEFETRTTMAPTSKGAFRIFMNLGMRQAAGADTGDPVRLVIAPHRCSIELPLPEFFQSALEGDPPALAAFLNLPPSHRNEFIKFVSAVIRPSAREGRIFRSLKKLRKQQSGRAADTLIKGTRSP